MSVDLKNGSPSPTSKKSKSFEAKQILKHQFNSIEKILTKDKDEVDRREKLRAMKMSFAEKCLLSAEIEKLSSKNLGRVVRYIMEREPPQQNEDPDEFIIDFEALQPSTLRFLERYIDSLEKFKQKRRDRKQKAVLLSTINVEHTYAAKMSI